MAQTAYWVILAGSTPTAFRASTREVLVPTLRQLQRTQPDVTLRWFERGRLWESPEAARFGLRAKPPRESRGEGWRPGGDHRDPRARVELSRDQRRARFKARARFHGSKPPVGPGDPSQHEPQSPKDQPRETFKRGEGGAQRPQKPWSGHRPPRKPWHGGGSPNRSNWSNRPGPSDRQGRSDRPPTSARPNDPNRSKWPKPSNRPDNPNRSKWPSSSNRPDNPNRSKWPNSSNRPNNPNRPFRPNNPNRPNHPNRPNRPFQPNRRKK